jgi:uncharacterized protein YigE (DUF2233 family)
MLWLAATVAAASGEPETPLAPGVTWRRVVHRGATYRVVTVDLRAARLSLVGQRPGAPHRAGALDEALPAGWVAATNAGLYHRVDEPVGLHVEDGAVHHPIELGDGYGNFFLRPNGVFTIDALGARVVESTAYAAAPPVTLATQSGPALLLDGQLHPRFLRESPSVAVRNAVGVADDHTVHLALSETPVRFWDLATLFRDALGCRDALYLDGNISGLWGPRSAGDAPSLPPWPDQHPFAGFLVVSVPERPAATVAPR